MTAPIAPALTSVQDIATSGSPKTDGVASSSGFDALLVALTEIASAEAPSAGAADPNSAMPSLAAATPVPGAPPATPSGALAPSDPEPSPAFDSLPGGALADAGRPDAPPPAAATPTPKTVADTVSPLLPPVPLAPLPGTFDPKEIAPTQDADSETSDFEGPGNPPAGSGNPAALNSTPPAQPASRPAKPQSTETVPADENDSSDEPTAILAQLPAVAATPEATQIPATAPVVALSPAPAPDVPTESAPSNEGAPPAAAAALPSAAPRSPRPNTDVALRALARLAYANAAALAEPAQAAAPVVSDTTATATPRDAESKAPMPETPIADVRPATANSTPKVDVRIGNDSPPNVQAPAPAKAVADAASAKADGAPAPNTQNDDTLVGVPVVPNAVPALPADTPRIASDSASANTPTSVTAAPSVSSAPASATAAAIAAAAAVAPLAKPVASRTDAPIRNATPPAANDDKESDAPPAQRIVADLTAQPANTTATAGDERPVPPSDKSQTPVQSTPPHVAHAAGDATPAAAQPTPTTTSAPTPSPQPPTPATPVPIHANYAPPTFATQPGWIAASGDDDADAPLHLQVTTVAGLPDAASGMDALALRIVGKSTDGDSQFTIRLDPPDLGRIDVSLNVDSNGHAQASLSADKPQTLDLLQRDAPVLERALKDAGLDLSGGLSFSLKGEGQQGDWRNAQNFAQGKTLDIAAVDAATPSPAAIAATGFAGTDWSAGSARLDIRV